MAYASSSSPFASVKGQNIFAGHKSSPSPSFSASPPPSSPFSAGLGESSTSVAQRTEGSQAHTATKRSGFEAFAASGSPFAGVARSKSPSFSSGSGLKLHRNKSPSRRANPANVNAFSSYATGGAQGFAIPAPKRARAGSPSGGSSRSSMERTSTLNIFGANGATDSGDDEENGRQTSFGEKLRAGRDEGDEGKSEEEPEKLNLTEQESEPVFLSSLLCLTDIFPGNRAASTGEEDEETVHQVRGKLFSLSSQSQWKERGTGTLKLNVRRSDGGGARLGKFLFQSPPSRYSARVLIG